MRLSIAVVAISSLAGSVSAAFVDTMTVPKTIRSGDGFNLTVTYSAQRQVPFLQERIWIGIIDGPEQYSDLTTLGDSTGSIEITPTDPASKTAFAGYTRQFKKGPVKVRAGIYSIHGHDYYKGANMPFIDMWEADVVLGDETSSETAAFKRINQAPKAFDF